VTALRWEVEAFSASFPTFGFTEESMKYPSTGQ